MKTYIGVDPGKSGALAVIYPNGAVETQPFDAISYVDVLNGFKNTDVVCCLEKVSAMPGQGVVSMFNFGHNFGFIEGVLQANGISYQLVPPQTWKKEFSLSSDKSKSIEVCQKLFPKVNLLATTKSKKPSDGIAEAILMAEYARRKL